MEVKKNLNNVQRKMLDEIYKEQFQKRERVILQERERGLQELTKKLLKGVAKEKDVKKMLEAGKLYHKLRAQLAEELKEKGVTVEGYLSHEPYLKMDGRYYGSGELPEVTAYKQETQRIELVLAEKKREMRAKIYGASVSYEEADKEIKELLKGL